MGDKEKQDSPEGVHTITQRETRKGTMGDKGRQDLREGRHTIQHQGRDPKIAVRTSDSTPFGKQWDSRPSGRRTHHPRRAQRESRSSRRPAPSKKGHKGSQRLTHHPRRGYNGSQDPREGGRTIQEGVERESRPSRRRTRHRRKGEDTPSKKGYKGQSRLLRRRTHHPRRGTMEVKTLEKADTLLKKCYIRSQDLREGGHTIQEGVQRESRPSRRRTHHPRKVYKGNQDPREGGQWQSRPLRRRTHHPKKGYQGSQDPREGGHTMQEVLR